MRRAGQVPTGVDRVVIAYLNAVLDGNIPAFGLIRSRLGYILLDGKGMAALSPLLSCSGQSTTGRIVQRRAWRAARRFGIGRVPPPLLGWMLRRHVPQYATYLNVSHANLTKRVLDALKSAIQARIAIMIHDVIPLEFPQFQRIGSVEHFAAMIERVNAHADLVIYNSEDTQQRAEKFLRDVPSYIVAHIGTDLVAPAPDELPTDLPTSNRYFVCVGTIEPRKNHAFLLDLWEEIGPVGTDLVIAGNRGWNNEAVFARLDALKPEGRVRETPGLSDGALAALIEKSAGVLFPSYAEGYGLPATEAAARGVPLIVNDLPVFREILGDIPIYASVCDRYLWLNKIKELAGAERVSHDRKQFEPPTWAAHFKIVLSLI